MMKKYISYSLKTQRAKAEKRSWFKLHNLLLFLQSMNSHTDFLCWVLKIMRDTIVICKVFENTLRFRRYRCISKFSYRYHPLKWEFLPEQWWVHTLLWQLESLGNSESTPPPRLFPFQLGEGFSSLWATIIHQKVCIHRNAKTGN